MRISPITTHVLDTATGFPARGIRVVLSYKKGEEWNEIAQAETNDDGRLTDWIDEQKKVLKGTYKVTFYLSEYFKKQNDVVFYPSADIIFNINDERHHHIPLLLSPYGYSTYRGS